MFRVFRVFRVFKVFGVFEVFRCVRFMWFRLFGFTVEWVGCLAGQKTTLNVTWGSILTPS